MFIISIMVERKKVRFANTTGKSLVQIKEINIEGKGEKVVPVKRKYVPANLSQISKKHDDAVKRAEKNVTAVIVKMEGLKRQMNFEKNDENAIKEEMAKQMKKKSMFSKKLNIEHLKNKLAESNKEQRKIMKKMLDAKLELNMAKNKLAAQKTSRM
jgi:predicted P-loop ATPase/GTPase